MKKCNLLAMLVIAFGVANFTTSCSSDTATTIPGTASATTLTATASDESQAAIISDDVDNEVDNYVTVSAMNSYSAVKSLYETADVTGPVITISRPDSTTFPKTITIDYGTTGFEGKRGNILKGKIIVVVSGKMNVVGSSRTITFDNFSRNGNAVTGLKVYTYKGLTVNVHPTWSISVKDTISLGDTTKVIWNAERIRERIGDDGTPLIYWDDIYSISGTSNGVNAKGVAYTSVIDANNPLIIGDRWPYFTKGTVTITSDIKTVVIDYGNGARDKIATATVNGVTKTFTMKN